MGRKEKWGLRETQKEQPLGKGFVRDPDEWKCEIGVSPTSHNTELINVRYPM